MKLYYDKKGRPIDELTYIGLKRTKDYARLLEGHTPHNLFLLSTIWTGRDSSSLGHWTMQKPNPHPYVFATIVLKNDDDSLKDQMVWYSSTEREARKQYTKLLQKFTRLEAKL